MDISACSYCVGRTNNFTDTCCDNKLYCFNCINYCLLCNEKICPHCRLSCLCEKCYNKTVSCDYCFQFECSLCMVKLKICDECHDTIFCEYCDENKCTICMEKNICSNCWSNHTHCVLCKVISHKDKLCIKCITKTQDIFGDVAFIIIKYLV